MNLPEMEAKAREIGRLIGGAIRESDSKSPGDKTTGFVLMLFNFGEGGHMTYLSNGERSDMVAAIKKFLSALESGGMSLPVNRGN